MFLYLNVLFKIFFRIKPCAYFIAATSNNNLGDNAQLMCIEKWIKEVEKKFDITVDEHIIMPDHLHFIIKIDIDNIEKINA